ncbi:MAG: thioesterase family protein [Gammaproteobacteria bacterium]|nr:thioesterase family protein [Gammaproteobacteria bacterium]
MNRLDRPHELLTPYEGTAGRQWDLSAPIAAPLCLHETTVQRAWVDYNKHMSESAYVLVFGDNSDVFYRYVGIDEAYRANGFSLYTVQTNVHFLKEVLEGEPLRFTYHVLDLDPKRVHVFQTMLHADTGDLLAVEEQMLAHVDMNAARSAPMPPELYERLQAIQTAHASLARPKWAGRVIGIRR